MAERNPELAARIRAAFAYKGGLSKADRAKLLGVSDRQVTRIQNAAGDMPSARLDVIAEATGVPRWFFDTGFEVPPQPEEPTLAEKLEALDYRTETEFTRLRAALALIAAGDLRRAQELLAQDGTGHRSLGAGGTDRG